MKYRSSSTLPIFFTMMFLRSEKNVLPFQDLNLMCFSKQFFIFWSHVLMEKLFF